MCGAGAVCAGGTGVLRVTAVGLFLAPNSCAQRCRNMWMEIPVVRIRTVKLLSPAGWNCAPLFSTECWILFEVTFEKASAFFLLLFPMKYLGKNY